MMFLFSLEREDGEPAGDLSAAFGAAAEARREAGRLLRLHPDVGRIVVTTGGWLVCVASDPGARLTSLRPPCRRAAR